MVNQMNKNVLMQDKSGFYTFILTDIPTCIEHI